MSGTIRAHWRIFAIEIKMNEEKTERIGVFGGSFDPVHTGHLIIAQDALEQLELSRVIFIPAAVPPHKQEQELIESRCRLEMLKLAVESNLRFSVSGMELKRGGVSYTVETIQALQEEYPGAELFFIVGLDSLVELHLWHRVDELLEMCSLVPFARGGSDIKRVADAMQLPAAAKEKLLHALIRLHAVEISSSEIRRRVAEGLSIKYLVPPEVEMYIFEHGLYI